MALDKCDLQGDNGFDFAQEIFSSRIKSSMKEHKYQKLFVDLSVLPERIPEELQSVDDVVSVFRRNVERIVSLVELPLLFNYLSHLTQHFIVSATYRKTGKFIVTEGEKGDPNDTNSLSYNIQQHAKRVAENYKTNINSHYQDMIQIGSSNFDYWGNHLGSCVSTGFDALAMGVIVSSWTAFETLSGDLWEVCLNDRPGLGLVALDAEPRDDDQESEMVRKGKVRYKMPVKLLIECDYNFRNRMGTLLRKKWDFSNKSQSLDAYVKVFRDKKHKNDLKSIFDDQHIRWLSATRNVIVHNAGIADPEFLQLTGKHPVYSTLKKGDPLLFDGENVHHHMMAAISGGNALVSFVREWLTNHIDQYK